MKISELTGTAYKVQYNPEFSQAFKSAVGNNVTPSLIPHSDEDTEAFGAFDISMVDEFVEEVRNDSDLLSQYGFTETDLKLFDYIKRHLKVSYIEF